MLTLYPLNERREWEYYRKLYDLMIEWEIIGILTL